MREGLFNKLQVGDIVIYHDNRISFRELENLPAVCTADAAYTFKTFSPLKEITGRWKDSIQSPPSCLRHVIYRDGRRIT